MRRKDREVKDFDSIIEILEKCRVLHLALISCGMPYAVQVNFGYEVKEIAGEKRLFVYFHGAGEGKKINAIKDCPLVSFCAESFAQVSGGEEPCSWTTFYESVIGFGKAAIITNAKEKESALNTIMIHNGYHLSSALRFFAYNAMALAKTAVVKIEVCSITGKRHKK